MCDNLRLLFGFIALKRVNFVSSSQKNSMDNTVRFQVHVKMDKLSQVIYGYVILSFHSGMHGYFLIG